MRLSLKALSVLQLVNRPPDSKVTHRLQTLSLNIFLKALLSVSSIIQLKLSQAIVHMNGPDSWMVLNGSVAVESIPESY